MTGLSLAARGVWVSAFTYAGDCNTKGFVSYSAAAMFAPGVDISGECQQLVDADLWEPVDGGWQIHDFDQAELDRIRIKQRERQQKRRDRLAVERENEQRHADVTSDVTPTSREDHAKFPAHAREETEREREITPLSPDGDIPPAGNILALKPDTPPRRAKPPDAAKLDAFTAAWNSACAPLPRLRKPPARKQDQRLVIQAWDQADGDTALLARAIRAAAAWPYYREQRYGFDTFCRHVDRWLGEATTPRPASASVWDA